MNIIEILWPYLALFGIGKFIFDIRSKIEEFLGKFTVGKWIMAPIMVPYVIYLLIKLLRDKDFLAVMERAQQQKKITDYF